MSQDDYSRAARRCDIIMKGGITSGIVYPKAVCRLALEYRFRAIGGTSAGAIAAAATAAAEYGRLKGSGTSFGELATLPETLARESTPGAGSRLFRLFQPQPSTARLFRTLTAAIRGERGLGGFAKAALRNYVLPAFIGFVLVLLVPLLSRLSGFLGWLPWILLAVVGGVIGAALALRHDVRTKVPGNFYGLTTGMGDQRASDPVALRSPSAPGGKTAEPAPHLRRFVGRRPVAERNRSADDDDLPHPREAVSTSVRRAGRTPLLLSTRRTSTLSSRRRSSNGWPNMDGRHPMDARETSSFPCRSEGTSRSSSRRA